MTAGDSTSLPKADRSEYYRAWALANKEKVKAYAAEYYKANKEKFRAYATAYYADNKESAKARATKWAKNNKERRKQIFDKWRNEHPDSCAKWRRSDYERNRNLWLARGKEFRANNPEIIRALKVAWHSEHPEAHAHHVGLRRTRKMQATPSWVDLTAIKAVYREASRLRKLTGTAWHVDHVVPLKHPMVCGLHVPANLRVIPARENQAKHNRLTE